MGPEIEDLGRQPFAAAHARMLALHAAVLHDNAPGAVLFVEHDAVYTAGRATPPEAVTTATVPVERGGQVTWHGPGQLVIYPVLRLPRRDVRDWLRRLEAFGVAVCTEFGLRAVPSVDGTGVFVGGRKVASIGVAVKQWINLHGIAINVAVDATVWNAIRPCGLSPGIMTDLSSAAGRPIGLAEARAAAARRVFLLTAADVRL